MDQRHEKHDVQALVDRVERIDARLADIGRLDLRELIPFFKRPGWTTPAEFLMALALADTIERQASALVDAGQAFKAGAKAVVPG